MKKITFFDATLLEGGAERVISVITKKLVEQEKIEIVLWYDYEPFYEIDSRVAVKFVPKEAQSNHIVNKLMWLHRYMKKETDVLVSFLAPINMIAIVAHWFSGKTVIVADRNDPNKVPVNFFIRKMRDFLYMFAEGIVLQTNKNKEYFSYIPDNKRFVIYNPIDLGENKGKALKTQKKKKIVSVGRLIPQKRQEILIEAFAKLYQNHKDYELIIYGEGKDRDILTEKIEQLDMNAHIKLPGVSKNVHEEIMDAEMFVLCSDFEGMPNALIEAMCLGLPVISTKVSGATDLIEDGKNGLLIDCGSSEQLYEAMNYLVENPDKKSLFASESAKLSERLEVGKISEEWLACINTICK